MFVFFGTTTKVWLNVYVFVYIIPTGLLQEHIDSMLDSMLLTNEKVLIKYNYKYAM